MRQGYTNHFSHVTYEYQYDGDNQTYDHATHYDYDIHGNVKTLVQDNQKMAQDPLLVDQQFKRMDYNYDLISGNVHRVSYENGKIDQWHHAYEYDADNRITSVYTTTTTPLSNPANGQISSQNEPGLTPFWDKEASYKYYAHGPLARTELGQEKVQGVDNVYTIQGWIKGVNTNILLPKFDPGQDAVSNFYGTDAYGYSLHYFDKDYYSISGQNNFLAGQGGSDLMANSSDLYNGNIARMVTTITHATTREILPLGNAYRYDQLNRLSESRSFTNLNLSSNTWEYSGNYDKKYWNLFRYDANGNILRQYRHNQVGNLIDGMDYLYKTDLQGRPIQNRLYQVKDVVGSGDFPDDIDDMGSFDPSVDGINVNNNYVYDQEGRLISDRQENIDKIVWRVDGKVAKIIRPGGIDKKNINFEYDAMGHRIAKHVLTSDNVLEKSTYYVLDAQGNTMSVYERKVNELTESIDFYQAEKHIYGSARLGVMNDSVGLFNAQNANYEMYVINHVIGKRNYELSNHLGNVLSVISDKPIPHDNAGTIDYYMADIREAHDYSPFGVLLNERTSTVLGSEKFRYGFQNQEMDDEVKGDGNSVNYKYRMHDPRLGRFFAVDPLFRDYPENSVYAFSQNRVIDCFELEGLEAASAKEGAKVLIVVIQGYTGIDPTDGKTRAMNDPHSAVDFGGLGDVYTAFGNQSQCQVNVFSSSHSSETIEDVVETMNNFKSANPNGQIILVGHSLGADNAIEASQETTQNISLIITLDIAAYWDTDYLSGNVTNAQNYYQNREVLGGEDIEFNSKNTTGTNTECTSCTHTSIDNDLRGNVISTIAEFTNIIPDYQPAPQLENLELK